jgi:hypothetical protein
MGMRLGLASGVVEFLGTLFSDSVNTSVCQQQVGEPGMWPQGQPLVILCDVPL